MSGAERVEILLVAVALMIVGSLVMYYNWNEPFPSLIVFFGIFLIGIGAGLSWIALLPKTPH
jgi:hypothetical protein